jgi:hypothetical protein
VIILKNYAFLSEAFDNWLDEVRQTRYEFIQHELEEEDYQKIKLSKDEFIEKFKKPFEGYNPEELEYILFLFNNTPAVTSRFSLKSFKGNYDFNKRLEWVVYQVNKLAIPGFMLGENARYYLRNLEFQCEYCGTPLGYKTKRRYCWTTEEEELEGSIVRDCERNWKKMYNRVHNFYDVKKQKKAKNKVYSEDDYIKQFIEYCEEIYAFSHKIQYPIYHWKMSK